MRSNSCERFHSKPAPRPYRKQKTRSPEPSSNTSCGRRLDRSAHRTREARSNTAARHQRIFFL